MFLSKWSDYCSWWTCCVLVMDFSFLVLNGKCLSASSYGAFIELKASTIRTFSYSSELYHRREFSTFMFGNFFFSFFWSEAGCEEFTALLTESCRSLMDVCVFQRKWAVCLCSRSWIRRGSATRTSSKSSPGWSRDMTTWRRRCRSTRWPPDLRETSSQTHSHTDVYIWRATMNSRSWCSPLVILWFRVLN